LTAKVFPLAGFDWTHRIDPSVLISNAGEFSIKPTLPKQGPATHLLLKQFLDPTGFVHTLKQGGDAAYRYSH